MNFYIGNSISEINRQNENVYFSTEFGDYLFDNKDNLGTDLQWFFDIDPYEIALVDVSTIPSIIESCSILAGLRIWEKYDFPKDGETAIIGLLDMSKKAYDKNKGLVSFGD